jgi:hypothetical protein
MIFSVANGKMEENWEKEKLGKTMLSSIFAAFDKVNENEEEGEINIALVKNLMFKVAECNFKDENPLKWP